MCVGVGRGSRVGRLTARPPGVSLRDYAGWATFTERVRKVLAMAREEAARLHHEYVGTEHILLGLIREGEGSRHRAAEPLRRAGRDPAEDRGDGQEGESGADHRPGPPYTSRAKKVLELAMSEARELSHSYVGTEHLLLGLLREEKGSRRRCSPTRGSTSRRRARRRCASSAPRCRSSAAQAWPVPRAGAGGAQGGEEVEDPGARPLLPRSDAAAAEGSSTRRSAAPRRSSA